MIDRQRRKADEAAYRARAVQPPESKMRAWHSAQAEGENKRITGRYIDAFEDATRDAKGGTPTQEQINRRFEP